ncbi:hypothetical protein COEREDRAFT_80069 [Coemansia reversa NRRL 1564]|uniref:Uncharacterized protein n=1 Tax=Coemansia reversa (strain ATCC 12441 / NRRL 1564) TaxID=763665 RepID=A0A2G5BGL0_COERN|nr:hypothetical protein COEREDRAFT_80069 [Coemansia reversa NRRL 1564]|eukprot:PIA18145.1 hypothetical protein COEREDRAFT_80069 [Coemansia reversa NRRL 1564]
MYAGPPDMVPRGGYSIKHIVRGELEPDTEFDYENAVRASYYGRRIYPSFDPANPRACPVQFIRHFEHAAHHNGLQLKAWARRLNSCLHGRAEDWAFDENPLEMTGSSWEVRKRQFLDWALLPAEQELRRQRLLRFYQAEAELSMDFVYTFEEAALGLRDYREDVWVRKCIANLLPPIRTGLFELWPDGLPVRFRDLRDSLYAVDWSLYEAASAPLRVVRCGTPFVYETSGQIPERQSRQQGGGNRMSVCSTSPRNTGTSSGNTAHGQHAHVYSPPQAAAPSILPTRRRRTAIGTSTAMQPRGAASSPPITASHSHSGSSDSTSHKTTNAGIQELMSTLSRIPEKERTMIMAALDKIAAGADDDSTQIAASAVTEAASTNAITPTLSSKPHDRPVTVTLPSGMSTARSGSGGGARAAAAVAAAAAAEQLVSMDATTQPVLSNDNARNNPHMPTDVTQSQQSSTSATDCSDETEAHSSAPGTIRLRTRPVTAAVDARRRSSSLLDDDENPGGCTTENVPVENQQSTPADTTAPSDERPALARRLSSRKSDSALTSATRSMRVGRASGSGDSVDDALQSPEFTVVHPELGRNRNPHSRRGRFANALLRLLR